MELRVEIAAAEGLCQLGAICNKMAAFAVRNY